MNSAIKFILLILLYSLIFSCSETEVSDWTILIYMAADNSLNSAALEDIEEMISAEFSDKINVIVQIDENQYSDDPGAKRYEIFPGSKQQISYLGEIDSGDPVILAQFANWGFGNYPSNKKALVIWSHGNGWYDFYNQFCPDKDVNSSISVPDGDFALAMNSINSHLDLLIIDACNMLTVEVITEIYKNMDFVIGSETSICPDGFPYDEIIPLFEMHQNISALTADITFTFGNSYMPLGSQNPFSQPYEISCSAVDCNVFPLLFNEITAFSQEWYSLAGSEPFSSAREECYIEFNDLAADIDIKDYFTKLQQEAQDEMLLAKCEDMLNVIDSTFISQFYIDLADPNGTQNYPAGTAVIWYPQSESTFIDLYSEYQKMDFSDTDWTLFLQNSFTSFMP